jgi:hypothetical protein
MSWGKEDMKVVRGKDLEMMKVASKSVRELRELMKLFVEAIVWHQGHSDLFGWLGRGVRDYRGRYYPAQ